MENYKNPISLFKQTNFSKTIWWKLKVNISGYQNETEDKLVTEIFKNRLFRIIYPNIYQNNHKFSRILVQLYEDGYVCCCLLYTSPSPRDNGRSRLPSSA